MSATGPGSAHYTATRRDARGKPESQPGSALHLHDLIDGHHVVIHMCHDPERTGDDQKNDQQPEGKRQNVVDVVRTGRDVEKEDEVNAHLRDRENGERDGNARLPDQRGARDKERYDGEQRRESQPDQVASDAFDVLVPVEAFVARRYVSVLLGEIHVATPIK